MIEFEITRDMDDVAHEVTCKAVFYNRNPIIIKHTGTKEFLQAKLCPEYLVHLHIIMDDYREFCNVANRPLIQNEVDRIIECQKWHRHGCHVRLAQDLLLRMEDLTEILPIDSSRDHAQHHLKFVKQTIEQFATERESLWVADRLIQSKEAA